MCCNYGHMTVVCWETNVAPDANGGCQLKEVVAGSDVQCVYRHERGRKDTKGGVLQCFQCGMMVGVHES